jgi:hypothetical protein
MFNVLNEVPFGTALEAIYFAGWRVRERDRYPDWRRWLPLRPGDAIHPGSVEVAARLIEELESRAGKPLSALPEAELEPIWLQAHRVFDARMHRESPPDPVRGERLLADLRRRYGEGYVHALAILT